MSEAWDGRPPGEAAERDGWHWIERSADSERMALKWCSVFCGSEMSFWVQPPPRMRTEWRYLGPCHTPAEVAALVAAARREGMERAMDAAHDAIHDAICEITECARVQSEVERTIRAAMQEEQSRG